MRIAWDGRGLVGPRTGIGWYTHHLLRGFESLNEDWEADLYLNKPVADRFSPQVSTSVIRYPNTVRLRAFWENYLLPLKLKKSQPDLWHSPLSVIPPKLPCPTIATIHDVAFLHFPEILPKAYLRYWTCRIQNACHHADRIIAVSTTTRADLQTFFQLPDEKVTVIHEAPDPYFTLPPTEDEIRTVQKTWELPAHFFVFVGTLEPRKNLPFLLEVYRLLLEQHPEAPVLLIAGGHGWLQEDLEKTIATFDQRVRLLGYLERRELRVLYHQAELVLIPSRYEGFGLPAVEAMACGGAVLAAKVSSLPEVVGEGGLLLPIDSPEVWVSKICDVLDSYAYLQDLRRKAILQASGFSWVRAAQETFRVYQEVLTGAG